MHLLAESFELDSVSPGEPASEPVRFLVLSPTASGPILLLGLEPAVFSLFTPGLL